VEGIYAQKGIIPLGRIENKIYLVRRHTVLLSITLADLYGDLPKILIQAVERNDDRFPKDFMFQLTAEEFQSVRPQIVTLKKWRFPRPLPGTRSDGPAQDYGALCLSKCWEAFN